MSWTIKVKDNTAGLSNAWLPYDVYIMDSDFAVVKLDTALNSAMSGTPYDAEFTVGVEASDTINVAIQLTDAYGDNMSVRGCVRAYLAGDANGDTMLALPPTGGVCIGTDGVLIPTPRALTNEIITDGNLIISGADAIKFKTTQEAVYTINGISLTKAATDNLVFTASHVITASKFGIILIQINAAGTVSTKVPLATQAYADAATALAALPTADAGNVALGYCAIQNNAGDWTANTDDLTNGSDLTTAAFVDVAETVAYGGAWKTFDLVSESDGDIDVNIIDTGVRTMYLALIMPNGSLQVSGAITFA